MSKLSAFIVLVALSPSVSSAKPVDASNNSINIAQIKSRLSHARELLGSTYKKSVVRKSEKIKDISSFVEATTKKFLPAKSKNVSKKLAKAILKHAREYNLDPVFQWL